jgi:NADH-quinone oxidoreductase subunit G
MSAQPNIPDCDAITIEIDGVAYPARKGQMVIHVADAAGVTIPRFCYHDKLPIAANCRMCLIEVERSPKPMPACATPVMDGMKVFTRSPKALAAQRGVMEFLLINHPLDCPICDQGGECELQDLALGFGRGISRFTETKRVVKDKDIGPLITTELTRCIHCTRCIRFLDSIAGYKELGATGRGENMTIGTYIERAVDSEMSGNVIDVCPVGALTSKPFRFTARAWEMVQSPAIAAHDCIGSNVYLHTRRGKVMRVVPRDNEAINEVWLSDRDRFSYQGIDSPARLTRPEIKEGGKWRQVSWDIALEKAAAALKRVVETKGADQLGVLATANATLEELFLLQKLTRGLGGANIDHRLRQADAGVSDEDPVFPYLGRSIEDIEASDVILLVGCNPRHEAPILAHRIRKAAQHGAKILVINPREFTFRFPLAQQLIAAPQVWTAALAGCARAAGATGIDADGGGADAGQQAIVNILKQARQATVLVGELAMNSPYAGTLRALAGKLATQTGAALGFVSGGANAAGAWLAGAVPHRKPGGGKAGAVGMHARDMLSQSLGAYLLFGVEPESDVFDPAAALTALHGADRVICCTAYVTDLMRTYADVLLPVGVCGESAGTYVNGEGRRQSCNGGATPPEDARPGWKVLRVLGNMLNLDGFDYQTAQEIRDDCEALCADVRPDNRRDWQVRADIDATTGMQRIGATGIYAGDAVLRRAGALQRTRDAQISSAVGMSPADADGLLLCDGEVVTVKQNDRTARMPVIVDQGILPGCVWIDTGTDASAQLGPAWGAVEISK